MRPIYDKCIGWINAITPDGVTIYVRDQNAPAPASPRVALRVAAVTDTAHYRDGINEDNTQDVVRWIGFTLAMQIYGTDILEAESIAAGILDMSRNAELRIDIMGRSVTFNRVISGPNSIDGVIGARIEPRATLDLQMSAIRNLVYDIGPIEEVEFTGDVSGNAVSRTVSAKTYIP